MNDGRRGVGFGFGSGDFGVSSWLVCLLACLLGVESGSKVVFVGLLCFLPLPLPLPCFVAGVAGRVFGARGKKGESASSEIVLAPLECLTIYTLHPAGER